MMALLVSHATQIALNVQAQHPTNVYPAMIQQHLLTPSAYSVPMAVIPAVILAIQDALPAKLATISTLMDHALMPVLQELLHLKLLAELMSATLTAQ